MEQTLLKFEEAVAEIEKRHIDRISIIEDMIDKIKQEKFKLEEVIDRLDQSSRQCHLRVFGLKEKPNENVAEELKHIFKANMSIDLKDDDIKLCYRVGSRETGHFADFLDLIQSSSYDIVAISETWLNGNVDGPAVQINNYNFVRRDRNDGSRGGGVGIYIKNYIKYKILDQGDSTEDIWYENEALSQKYDQLDQFTRSNNIRIFRLKEKPQEDVTTEVINLLTSHLGVTINANDIYSCMRVGKKLTNTPRGILVKFLKPNIKRNIYKNKKMLKGSGVVIKEDLTENRLKLMDAAIERTTLRSVWSRDGTIYASKGGKVIVIKNKSDLDKL
nr:unnamed protein product [Callosobruchus analis]